MSIVGPFSFSTAVNDTGVGVSPWSTASNALTDNNIYATTTGTVGVQTSNYLKVTNIGSTGIPAGSTISRITFAIRRFRTGGTSVTTNRLRAVVGGVIQGTDLDSNLVWGTSEAVELCDMLGGLPTLAQIEASDFGAALSVLLDGSAVASVDQIYVSEIEYTAPAPVDITLGIYEIEPQWLAMFRDHNPVLGMYFLRKDWWAPTFARSSDIRLGFYEVEYSLVGGHKGVFSWDVTLGYYQAEYDYKLPRTGTSVTLGCYALEPQLMGTGLSYGRNVSLGLYQLDAFRFSYSVAVDRVITLGYYPIFVDTVLGLPFPTQPNPSAVKVYVETVHTDSRTIYGVTLNEPFKSDPGWMTEDEDANTIHLAPAKPVMATVFATFLLESPTPLEAGDFHYLSANRLLELENINSLNPILIDPVAGADDEAIEIIETPGFFTPIFSWGTPN